MRRIGFLEGDVHLGAEHEVRVEGSRGGPSSGWRDSGLPSVVSKTLPERERLKERWLDTQELSGGPFRISAINRHRQFALLHAAAKARAKGNVDGARGALSMSKAARIDQWVDRLSSMELIERRHSTKRNDG